MIDNSLQGRSRGRGRNPATLRISRRTFLRLMGGAAAGAFLGGCAPSPGGAGPHGSKTTQLVYQDWRTDWFSEMAQRMLEAFHASHPNIHVFFTQDPDDVDTQMMADFAGGTAPDVLAGCCDFFPAWAQQGYLLDLRPFVSADLDRATIDDWDPAQYQALFTTGGLQFALPKYHGALALFYNKDMFDFASVPYPDRSWSHDDYAQAMKRMMSAINRNQPAETRIWGSMLDISWERIQVHINSWGGHLVDPKDNRRSMMAQAPALDAMTWVHERMWKDDTMASPLDVQNLETRQAFIRERVAMVEDGSWALKDILEEAHFRVGVAPLPIGPVRRATLATTDGFAIYGGTRYPEAAWELLKFLISPAYGRAMAQAHLLQPARVSLVEEWIDAIRQEYPRAAREMDIAAFAEGHIQGYSVVAEIFRNMTEARRLLNAAWEEIFTLGRAPIARMRETSAAIEQTQQDD